MMDAIIDRHENIALMYSGGKDSTACLYLLKKWWNKINVVWVNSGATFPEVLAFMENMKKKLPRFIEVKSNQPAYVDTFGLPTEILPVDYTAIGQAIGVERSFKLNNYIDCCATNIWYPALKAIKSLGCTLVIRGQKNCDFKKSSLRSGVINDGVEYLFPVEKWSNKDVFDYLKEQDFCFPSYYNLAATSLDCWNCTAYCYEHKDKLAYMRDNHPKLYEIYKAKLYDISLAVKSEMLPLLDMIGEK